jgi:hypothetical protein
MNREERIEIALTKGGALRGEMNKLESLVNTCNSEAVLQMHRTTEELSFTYGADLINIGEALDIDNKITEIGQKFQSQCKCNK